MDARPRPASNRTLFDPSQPSGGGKTGTNSREKDAGKGREKEPGSSSTRGGRRDRDRDRDRDRGRERSKDKERETKDKDKESQQFRIEKRQTAATPVPSTPAAILAPTSVPVTVQSSNLIQPPAPQALLKPPSQTQNCFKMISDSLRVATGPDAIPSLLAESPGCFIIGAIGRKGAGKSTVLNLFANPYAAANNPRFTAASVGPPFNTKGTTRGVDVHSTTDGLVLVDSQPIHLPSQKKSSKRANATSSMDDATLCKNSEKMTLLMFSVCHIILVVSSGNSTRDEELWAFLRRMEAVKYRADGGTQVNDDDIDALQKPQYRRRQRQRKPTIPLESGAAQSKKNSTAHEGDSKNGSNPQDESTGGNRDSSSSDGSDSSEDGDEIENEDESQQRQAKISKATLGGNKVSGPATANVESGRNSDPDIFFPDLIFVHNRAKPSDFGTNSYAATAAAVARSFRGSRLKFSSGIIHFGMAFPRIYSSVVHTSKRETEATPYPNLWFLPSIPSIPSLHLLPMGPAPTASVAGDSGESSHYNGTTTTSLLDRISVGFNQGDTNHVKTFLKDMEGVPARYTVLCDMLRDSVLEVPRYPFELPPPISSVYKTVASLQRNAVAAADVGGAGEGGQMGKSSFVVGKKWFQISEKEWYRSAIGIWSCLEGER